MRHVFVVVLVAFLLFTAQAPAAETGAIAGRVTRPDGSGIGGVVVVITELRAATLTDRNGRFVFSSVPAGRYSLSFSAGESADSEEGILVTAGATATADKILDWRLTFADTVTVYSASRKAERIVEAPAAITTIPEEAIQAEAATGQLPRVLESAPGVDFTQSGLYDFNFNTRGFNSSLNRRILTLIDGRDPAIAFLGAQEWAALSFPLDEIANVELVRGPGSALYGAGAFNGVLNMTTRQPRYSQGGKVQLSAGELSTIRGDARYAGAIGSDWYFRVVGGYAQSDDFTRARNVTTEYAGLALERVPLSADEVEISYGGLRLDKHFENGLLLTLDGGYADVEGPTFQTGIGRVQVTDSTRPWARFNLNTQHWNFSTYYDARDANNQIALSSGGALFEDSYNLSGELQGNTELLAGKGRLVGGVNYKKQNVDTANPAGIQTLMAEKKDENFQSVFAQFDYNFTPTLKGVVAGRYDDSSLHDGELSPKASLVYELVPNQTIRASYNQAFQVPNYSEFFLRAPAGPGSVNLAPIEAALAPLLGGISLGFNTPTPIFALGNSALEVEKITGYEIGYTGILRSKLFITADFYRNRVEDFVTDLLPGVNPAFPPYQPPAGLSPQAAATLNAVLRGSLPPSLIAAMTTINGRPAFVFSYANSGKVDTQGAELSFNYYVSNSWVLDFNYSWFDFDVKEQRITTDVLLPNAPEHKFNAGVTYRTSLFDLAVKYRWVDGFPWAAGIFQGVVPQYDVVNLTANYRLGPRVSVGANVSNLLNNRHREAFGGDILERRALGFLSVGW
ncbi:MAG TPA: TonB-dependent receptor [Thermoanaerobaculia bacterium]|nr:TonB-dependent receptor [Thermoanaerobaculia bacterium]